MFSDDLLSKLIFIYVTYENIPIKLKQSIKNFIFKFSDVQIKPSFRNNFNIEYNPFQLAYGNCFKLMVERDNIIANGSHSLSQYELLCDIIKNCINPGENTNKLLITGMEIFEITLDEDLLYFNINFMLNIINNINFEDVDELKELLEKCKYFYKRFNFKIKPIAKRVKQLITILEAQLDSNHSTLSGENTDNEPNDGNTTEIDSEVE